ncbi:MAG: ATP-binding protein [Sphingobium sp.]
MTVPSLTRWQRAGRWLRSSHIRFIGLILLLELLFGVALMLSVAQLIRADLDATDSAVAEQLRDDLAALAREQGTGALASMIAARTAETSDEVILLSRSDGRKIAGNLSAWPPVVPATASWTEVDLYRTGDDQPSPFGVIATRLPGGERLLVGQRVDDSAQVRETVENALTTVLWMALPLALAGAWLVVHIIDQRVERIVRTAADVRAGDISRRVPLDGSGDSFDQLGGAINGMLDRIGGLLSELRLLTDSMAHDLRSPLTRLRARIDRAVLSDDPEVMRGAIEGIGREADQLLAMLTTALEVSRAEAGIGRDRFVALDLAEALTDLCELYEPLVEDSGRTLVLAITGKPIVQAHRELLGQAVSNLIDNALKYGKGQLTLSLADKVGAIVIALSDEGPGIPADREEEATRRFGRLDAARSEAGAGLGLSLVSAVAQLHGGTMRLVRADGAFTVEMRLPAV